MPGACLIFFFNILNNRLFRSARGSTSVSTLMSWLDLGKQHSWAEDSLGLHLGPTADELGDAQQVPILTCGSSHWRLGRIGQHPFPGLASTVLGTKTPSTGGSFCGYYQYSLLHGKLVCPRNCCPWLSSSAKNKTNSSFMWEVLKYLKTAHGPISVWPLAAHLVEDQAVLSKRQTS